eukprot:TRINITY_DN115898_c0_g1_i1.p1 TRINITY_DN115898_c0_g1~~TRINITY_DN115898_c0_g1_i1.p1  ORF type:complete len:426 (+),score=21.97 TRINITY_DN115898_c0_g1_i1:70-1347(+)
MSGVRDSGETTNSGGHTQFKHLTGARCLAAFWIVCAHYLPKSKQPSFNGAVFRVNVAVCFFVVVSGFVTHLAYGTQNLSGFSRLSQFYVRKLGRVVFTFWVALIYAVSVLALAGVHWDMWYLVRCALFMEQWLQMCPNGPSWFIFAMIPSWILYPLTRKLVMAAEQHGGKSLFILLLIFYAISVGPAVFILLFSGTISWGQHHNMEFWPPGLMADFAIGMTAAALVRQRSAAMCGKPATPNAYLADVSMLSIVLVVFLLPRPATTWALHLNGWEPLLDHLMSLPIAGFLIGSSGEGGAPTGLCARLLAHKALVSLGEMSFQVYIFQRPVHDTFGLAFSMDSPEVFMVYALFLWIFAGLYARYVENPVNQFVKSFTANWVEAESPLRSDELPLTSHSPRQMDAYCSWSPTQEEHVNVLAEDRPGVE